MNEGWQKIANTIMLSVITIIITVGTSLIVSGMTKLSEKLDNIVVQSAVNSIEIKAYNIEAEIWKDRIVSLETGQSIATSDRITRTEAMQAIDDIKNWVDKYYARK